LPKRRDSPARAVSWPWSCSMSSGTCRKMPSMVSLTHRRSTPRG
jgi:hypothetical protein